MPVLGNVNGMNHNLEWSDEGHKPTYIPRGDVFLVVPKQAKSQVRNLACLLKCQQMKIKLDKLASCWHLAVHLQHSLIHLWQE